MMNEVGGELEALKSGLRAAYDAIASLHDELSQVSFIYCLVLKEHITLSYISSMST